jgi:hypothetical protein
MLIEGGQDRGVPLRARQSRSIGDVKIVQSDG